MLFMKPVKRILLVDDDIMVNIVTERLLARHSKEYEITTFTNPVKAIAHLINDYNQTGSLPDIILLDIRMPELTGFEFLDKISEYDFSSSLQVIMYTSSTAAPDQERAQTYSNVIGYMQKPFSVELFSKIVSEIVQC